MRSNVFKNYIVVLNDLTKATINTRSEVLTIQVAAPTFVDVPPDIVTNKVNKAGILDVLVNGLVVFAELFVTTSEIIESTERTNTMNEVADEHITNEGSAATAIPAKKNTPAGTCTISNTDLISSNLLGGYFCPATLNGAGVYRYVQGERGRYVQTDVWS